MSPSRRNRQGPPQQPGIIPANAPQVPFTVQVQQHQTFSGPIPPPEMLERYEKLVPGAANRILTMAEAQSSHRRDLEGRVIRGNVRSQTMGQVLAFILCSELFGGSIYLLANGREIGGLTTLVTAVAGFVGVFVYGRRQQAKEREAKRAQGFS